jgi:hypothetical protein
VSAGDYDNKQYCSAQQTGSLTPVQKQGNYAQFSIAISSFQCPFPAAQITQIGFQNTAGQLVCSYLLIHPNLLSVIVAFLIQTPQHLTQISDTSFQLPVPLPGFPDHADWIPEHCRAAGAQLPRPYFHVTITTILFLPNSTVSCQQCIFSYWRPLPAFQIT